MRILTNSLLLLHHALATSPEVDDVAVVPGFMACFKKHHHGNDGSDEEQDSPPGPHRHHHRHHHHPGTQGGPRHPVGAGHRLMFARVGDAWFGEEQLQKLFLETGNCDTFLAELKRRFPNPHGHHHDDSKEEGSSSNEDSSSDEESQETEQTVAILET